MASLAPTTKYVLNCTKDEIQKFEKRMQPGVDSEGGFLKVGDSLYEVCQQDFMTLQGYHLECKTLADVLEGLIRAKKEGLKIFGFKINYTATNGFQECPFRLSDQNFCHIGREDYTITNSQSQILQVSELVIKMVRDHGFFETGPYRLDPKQAIQFLGLDKQLDHYPVHHVTTLKYETYDDCDEKAMEMAEKYEEMKIELDNDAVLYVLPYKEWDQHVFQGKTEREKIEISLQAKGKNEGEIAAAIEAKRNCHSMISDQDYDEWLKQVIQPSSKLGERFVHIFNTKNREESPLGARLAHSIKIEGVTVYKMVTGPLVTSSDASEVKAFLEQPEHAGKLTEEVLTQVFRPSSKRRKKEAE